jgi:tetratricopeptide (TPR) repeat protein
MGVRPASAALLVFLLTACAGRDAAVQAVPPAPPLDVEALIGTGCYKCLESAFATAEGTSPEAAFQVAVLLALRSKELGLPYAPWTARASDRMPVGAEWPLYLEIADVVRVDPLSGDREDILTLTATQRRSTETVTAWIDALQSGVASPLFRAYLDLTLSCSLGQREEAIGRVEERFGGAPLIQYRIGTCGSQAHLVALRERIDAYVDADFPLGRNALDSAQPDQEEALRRYRSARAAFPESPLITASIGDVHRQREEWPEALEAYDATLALVATHRDALLGRTIALSNLSRHQEAIAAAGRLLELGNWFVGAAHFWRAWNYYNLGDIPRAREDVDEARLRGRSAATLVLAGMVAWRQQLLDEAETQFQAALDVDRGQCEAAALQGGVRTARMRWADAIESFEHARQCFDLTIALRRKLIDDIEAGPGSPAGKAGQKARHERAISEAQQHRDDAARNAAAVQRRIGRN